MSQGRYRWIGPLLQSIALIVFAAGCTKEREMPSALDSSPETATEKVVLATAALESQSMEKHDLHRDTGERPLDTEAASTGSKATTSSDASAEDLAPQMVDRETRTERRVTARAGCQETTVKCGEDCVDLTSSKKHCGKCGARCFSRQSCDEGVCSGLGVVSVAELNEALPKKDFLLINVRMPAVGLIPGTDASIAHDNLEELKSVIGDDLDRRVVLYCGTATRVQTPLRTLIESGYRSVSFVDGGIMAWQMAGLPMSK